MVVDGDGRGTGKMGELGAGRDQQEALDPILLERFRYALKTWGYPNPRWMVMKKCNHFFPFDWTSPARAHGWLQRQEDQECGVRGASRDGRGRDWRCICVGSGQRGTTGEWRMQDQCAQARARGRAETRARGERDMWLLPLPRRHSYGATLSVG